MLECVLHYTREHDIMILKTIKKTAKKVSRPGKLGG